MLMDKRIRNCKNYPASNRVLQGCGPAQNIVSYALWKWQCAFLRVLRFGRICHQCWLFMTAAPASPFNQDCVHKSRPLQNLSQENNPVTFHIFPLYRLFNKDPYNGLLFSPSNCAVQSPIDPKQPGPLFSLLIWTILSYPTEETKEGTSHSSRKFQTHGKNWIKW